MLWHVTSLLLLAQGASACISTAPRTFSAPSVQFSQPVGVPFQVVVPPPPPPAGAAAAGFAPRPVVAGSAVEPVLQPIGAGGISRQPSVLEQLLGHRISLSEFSADGYNAEGGGPVNSGAALSCRVDGTPCCWANVPPPDDQLDWQIATGTPDAPHFQNVPAPEGSYLVAYARGAAPSDEAQFASCSIACASSPITVRAKHWHSENVLLQVCQRESFPQSASFNPLLNCQEFPLVQGLETTEVVLPKASLIDIVFVASNFVGENGDMAILDDIELSYDRNGEECIQQQNELNTKIDEAEKNSALNSVEESEEQTQGAQRFTLEKKNSKSETATVDVNPALKDRFENLKSTAEVEEAVDSVAPAKVEAVEETKFAGSELNGASGQQARGGQQFARAHGISHAQIGDFEEPSPPVLPAVRAQGKTIFKESVKDSSTGKLKVPSVEEEEEPVPLNPAKPSCPATSCTFEEGNTCHYQDAHQTQSIRGLTSRFQVVTGQFMNKITGVKSGIVGEYYAATFLFPREMAGLETVSEPFTKSSRIRFHYYESTHGVQLKACCGSIDECPFQSDKFVSVNDRVWKTGSLICPQGTEKVIFVCENTRTNQGACAIDDIEMVRSEGEVSQAASLC
ncbi:hypothetical protein PFISCL1PPCAC_27461 [Pristionchus fissidentatus]|uniref:Ig-like domain-containing protein n=1 Tax=Pristionchus fissidentatus TaxID=1538716 RepID=A0AAV5WZQ9_9BILA|nr:hypothetical protein PFISCL1PPCAC_27461 [Pristionchus fissidentatus]